MAKKEALERVRQKIASDRNCPLRETATNLVFGKGSPDAKIMFIGEAPGEKEDLLGLPFVGAAGKQLDRLLGTIGLTLEDAYIANILKYRPPNNRDPNEDEIRQHTPYLIEQIRIIKPRIIATLGNFSTKFVLSHFDVDGMARVPGITSLHGKAKAIMIDDLQFTVVPLYHPAAILYKPSWRAALEEDFLKMKEIIDGNSVVSSVLEAQKKQAAKEPKETVQTKSLSEFF